MKNIKVSVRPDRQAGSMRKIAGINNSVTINYAGNIPFQKPLFDSLGVSYVRYHDAALDNPGYSVIDVSRIFPMFRLDENDPDNYVFGPTDDYLALLPENDIVIDFRLGESIEHSAVKYRVLPPPDFEKWARICANIIRHYKKGWADGFFYDNLRYCSIWEEPDGKALRFGEYEEYLKLFVTAYRTLHAEFPELKIGGPNGCGFWEVRCEQFLAFCRENGIKPDFIAGTMYSPQPEDFAAQIRVIGTLLEKYDCRDTEIIATEWHMAPASWDFHVDKRFDRVENAAFTASSLIHMLDTDVTAAYYYAWCTGSWSVIKPDAQGILKPLPVYYGIKYFTELTSCEERLDFACSSDAENIDMLAGKTGNTVKLLVSCYNCDTFSLDISVPGCTRGNYRFIPDELGVQADEKHPLTSVSDGVFHTETSEPGMAVFLFEFELD